MRIIQAFGFIETLDDNLHNPLRRKFVYGTNMQFASMAHKPVFLECGKAVVRIDDQLATTMFRLSSVKTILQGL